MSFLFKKRQKEKLAAAQAVPGEGRRYDSNMSVGAAVEYTPSAPSVMGSAMSTSSMGPAVDYYMSPPSVAPTASPAAPIEYNMSPAPNPHAPPQAQLGPYPPYSPYTQLPLQQQPPQQQPPQSPPPLYQGPLAPPQQQYGTARQKQYQAPYYPPTQQAYPPIAEVARQEMQNVTVNMARLSYQDVPPPLYPPPPSDMSQATSNRARPIPLIDVHGPRSRESAGPVELPGSSPSSFYDASTVVGSLSGGSNVSLPYTNTPSVGGRSQANTPLDPRNPPWKRPDDNGLTPPSTKTTPSPRKSWHGGATEASPPLPPRASWNGNRDSELPQVVIDRPVSAYGSSHGYAQAADGSSVQRAKSASGQTQTKKPDEPGVTKFTVEIFCQRKASGSGPPREETPRDIREFRLAKLAVLHVQAGTHQFVSLDVVFGELDQGIASLLEKHFVVIPTTKMAKRLPGAIEGGDGVWLISPLRIAYQERDSLLYIKFRSDEDERKFRNLFEFLQPLAGLGDNY